MFKILRRAALAAIFSFSALATSNAQEVAFDEKRPETWCLAPLGFRLAPNVLGLDPESAQKIVKACGLEWDNTPSPTAISYFAIGSIGQQQPNGGTIMRKGDKLKAVLSSGLYLPNLIGLSQTEATDWLRERQLTANVVSKRNPKPVGQVFAQVPISGVGFNFGEPIDLLVSEGLWVDVPALGGKKWELARAELQGLGLVVEHGGGDLAYGQRWRTNCELDVWYPVVDSTAPASGSRTYEGDKVRVKTKRKTEFRFIQNPGVICQ